MGGGRPSTSSEGRPSDFAQGEHGVSAVIVAGGKGSRMGRPKQLLPVAGKPMLHWSIEAFAGMAEVGEVIVAAGPETLDAIRGLHPKLRLAPAGDTRLASVRAGLAAATGELVAVHDGARPLVDAALIRRCLDAAREFGASVAAAPVVDTLKEADGGFVASTPDRARYWSAQTPQCYRRSVLAGALDAFKDVSDATDESQLVERSGTRVRLVESGRENLKVTAPLDLAAAEAYLGLRGVLTSMPRGGYGFDLHKLASGRPLMLGGLHIPFDKGLLGHSDGDVLLHAVSDALLGALALGDIGGFFPPGQPETAGIDSRRILSKALEQVRERGGRIISVDATLVAERPPLSPHYDALRSSLAALLEVELSRVSVKAKSHEGLGELGRGEAIACHAFATVLAP